MLQIKQPLTTVNATALNHIIISEDQYCHSLYPNHVQIGVIKYLQKSAMHDALCKGRKMR